jgi:hypothetical protein
MLKMTSTEDRQTDASDRAASIARWDDEGGRCQVSREQNGRKTSKKTPAPAADDRE